MRRRATAFYCSILSAGLSLSTAPLAQTFELNLAETALPVWQDSTPTPGSDVAVARFADGRLPVETVSGWRSEEVWHLPGDGAEIGGFTERLIADLAAQGYDLRFQCQDRGCGGFDFRFALPIAQGPHMHVDLGNFHYLMAQKETADGPETVALTVSAGATTAYLHAMRVTPSAPQAPTVTASSRDVDPLEVPVLQTSVTGDLADMLLSNGRSPLDDLAFDPGASSLTDGPYESLQSLAAFLQEDPNRRVVLVGHTDAQGSLSANIRVSEARARAVLQRLVSRYNAPATQIDVQGIGYLAPRAENASEEGRRVNRRVEVVLIAQ